MQPVVNRRILHRLMTATFFHHEFCSTCLTVIGDIQALIGRIVANSQLVRAFLLAEDTDHRKRHIAGRYGIWLLACSVRIDRNGSCAYSNAILTAKHCVAGVTGAMNEEIDARNEKMKADKNSIGKEAETLPHFLEVGVPIHYILENEVVGPDQEPTTIHLAHASLLDNDHDLALLYADGVAIPEHEVAELADNNPALGEPVHVVGHVKGLYWSYIQGSVSAYRGDLEEAPEGIKGPFTQISAPVFFAHTPMPYHYVNVGSGPVVPLKVIPIWIDADFEEDDQLAIDDAIQQWNFALNGFVRLEVHSTRFNMDMDVVKRVMNGGGWMILKINSTSEFIHDDPARGHFTLGFANCIGGNRIYLIRDRIQNEWVTGLMLHEIGHLLGATHDGHDLMQANYKWEDFRCIDSDTIAQVASYQHIPANRLNYCQYGNAN
ncbi:unnamed protein product [Sphagnum balticum]